MKSHVGKSPTFDAAQDGHELSFGYRFKVGDKTHEVKLATLKSVGNFASQVNIKPVRA